MNHRYGTITTAALAALVLGVAPAMAQVSRGLDTNVNAGANVNTGTRDVNTSSPTNQATKPGQSSNSDGSSYIGNPSAGVSGNGGVSSTDAISGAKKSKSDESMSGNVKDNVKGNESSPSASPSMGDDRDQMKQQEQIDKKTGLDRADQAAGPHGAEGRDNARTRGERQ